MASEVELDQPGGVERLNAWRRAVADTAGSVAYLPEGRAYLEEVRAAERAKAAKR